jgi:hypothetical protein
VGTIRLLLWVVIGFIVWKMLRLAAASRQRKREEEQEPPFAHIEETEYEDMSKPPEDPPGPNEGH